VFEVSRVRGLAVEVSFVLLMVFGAAAQENSALRPKTLGYPMLRSRRVRTGKCAWGDLATITGTVLDPNGNVVHEARVQITSLRGATVVVVESGGDGLFKFAGWRRVSTG